VNLTREHVDELAGTLPPLLLDRQRIIHSAAFRRLQFKTQVFLATDADHFRTRLTHTLEVAQLARMIAERLGLSGELAEVVALAHDLGHPPFGHAGERALDECMRAAGGFEHNVHSLRVVEYLEHSYPGFRGLNLTRAVRECLAKHTTRFDQPGSHPLQDGAPPPAEGQIAALADRVGYALHDLQDALYAGLIEPADLKAVRLWSEFFDRAAPLTEMREWRRYLRPAIDRLRAALIADIAATFTATARASISTTMEARFAELEDFLLARVYRHPRLVRMDQKARRALIAVFDAYRAQPGLLPRRYFARIDEQGALRVVGDYVAGMTDRFCLKEHTRLFDPRV
jgi:dGTPase